MAEMATEHLILFDRTSSYHELTSALVRQAGIAPRGTIEVDNIDAAKRMVEQRLGIALLPLTSVHPLIGSEIILNAFIIVVAGGLGNFRGAAIVALAVGEFNALGQLIPGMKPSLLTITLFCLVILLLMVRAQRQHSLVRL